MATLEDQIVGRKSEAKKYKKNERISNENHNNIVDSPNRLVYLLFLA